MAQTFVKQERQAEEPPAGTPSASRPFAWRRWLLLPLLAMGLLLIFPPEPLDFALSRLFWQPGEGFPLRRDFWLQDVLHDGVRFVAVGFAVLLLLLLTGSLLHLRLSLRLKPWRRHLAYLVVAITAASALMPPLKAATRMHCPRELTEFDGRETYVPLTAPAVAHHKSGRCWPGGHAATAFSLLALFFALRDNRPRLARRALYAVLAAGAVLSAAQIMRGEHFLSHNVWTLLIDWTICLLLYRLLLYRPGVGVTR